MSDREQLSLFEAAAPRPEPAREEPAQVHIPQAVLRATGAGAPDGDTPEALRAILHRRLDTHLDGGLAELVLTDNRSVLLSGRPLPEPLHRTGMGRDPGETGWRVRIHWSFAMAPEELVHAAASVLTAPRGTRAAKRARNAVRRWIDVVRRAVGPGPAPAPWQEVIDAPRRAPDAGVPAGHVHDREAILDGVNRRYFGGRLQAVITWGRAGRPGGRRRRRRRSRSTIKLGSWSPADRLIRIHPVLDHTSVPTYVVASVVHHELLHAGLGTEVCGGRRRHHTPEFRRREREFHHHERARRWIRERMGELLERRARLG